MHVWQATLALTHSSYAGVFGWLGLTSNPKLRLNYHTCPTREQKPRKCVFFLEIQLDQFFVLQKQMRRRAVGKVWHAHILPYSALFYRYVRFIAMRECCLKDLLSFDTQVSVLEKKLLRYCNEVLKWGQAVSWPDRRTFVTSPLQHDLSRYASTFRRLHTSKYI